MAELNIDEVLLLIHGEIATAVASVGVYGNNPGIELSNIRVRMGQNTSTTPGGENSDISLNTERFPPAKDGWLIDVNYTPSEQQTSSSESQTDTILPSQLSQYFAKTPISKISGIGQRYEKSLNALNIKTIQHLSEFKAKSTNLNNLQMTHSQLRSLQSMAHLALSIPTTNIPRNLADIPFKSLVDLTWKSTSDSILKSISQESQNQIARWLQQLELCLDNDFFNSLDFNQLLN